MVSRILLPFLSIALLGLSSAWATPQIQQWQTSNGARVLFVEAPELPMVDVQIMFDAGAARDGDKGGVALMTNAMLPEGAGRWNTDRIAERIDDIGAEIGNSAHRDMSVFSLRSLTDPELLQQASETLAVILSQPTFPADAFERERKRLLVALQRKKQSPESIADDAFNKLLFQGHPYENLPEGNEASIKSLTIADLKAFYRRYMVGNNAVMAIVGKQSRQQAEALAEKLIGKLPAGKQAPALPPVPELKQAVTKRIDFPSSQTHLLIGQPGMKRGDRDYFALYLGNHSLGGSGLVSIISNEIREKRGLAYSSYSYFSPMRENGAFVMGMQTRNDQADEALKVINQVLADYVKNGPTAEQVKASKMNVTGGFALKTDSNKKILGYLGMIGFYNMPLNYLDTFISNINQTSQQAIQDAFARRIQPDKLITVIVGGNGARKTID